MHVSGYTLGINKANNTRINSIISHIIDWILNKINDLPHIEPLYLDKPPGRMYNK